MNKLRTTGMSDEKIREYNAEKAYQKDFGTMAQVDVANRLMKIKEPERFATNPFVFGKTKGPQIRQYISKYRYLLI